MSEPFIGEIRTFAGNFAPKGWALCAGQILPIMQNTALFAILGTTYGGDGKTTFGLPNLQACAPMHWGDGPGLTPRTLGETSGAQAITLTVAEMPQHTHAVNASSSAATATSPDGTELAEAPLYAAPPFTSAMSSGAVQPSGGNQAHNNLQPCLGVTFIIALQGVYPPRS